VALEPPLLTSYLPEVLFLVGTDYLPVNYPSNP